MAKFYTELDETLRQFIGAQHIFFHTSRPPRGPHQPFRQGPGHLPRPEREACGLPGPDHPGEQPRKSLDLWREMEGSTPMGHVDGTAFPGTFEHIASGYAAGYYGYMWAKVIALDLISAFGPMS